MARDVINMRVELDRESDGVLRQWAKQVSIGAPSKRSFACTIIRRATKLWKQNPNDEALVKLGLVKHGLDQ